MVLRLPASSSPQIPLIAVGVAVEADEVVVDEKYWAAPAIRIELLELGNYQVRGLGARNPSVDLDDVAELALERAAARVRHGHGAVISRLNETEVRQWCSI